MFDRKYKIFLNDIYFDSLYGTDYYYDKPNFFAHGAKQFFTIYQILRNGDFKAILIEELSGRKIEFENPNDFKIWTAENYNSFKDHLDEIYWDKYPESNLKAESSEK